MLFLAHEGLCSGSGLHAACPCALEDVRVGLYDALSVRPGHIPAALDGVINLVLPFQAGIHVARLLGHRRVSYFLKLIPRSTRRALLSRFRRLAGAFAGSGFGCGWPAKALPLVGVDTQRRDAARLEVHENAVMI